MPPRTIAIGDVHGCSRALEALLQAIQPRPADLLVTLGDYVNRGPDSRRVLDRLIVLERQCHLVPLLGNHDQMFLEVLREARAGYSRQLPGWLDMGGAATLASYGTPRDRMNLAALARVPDKHVAFLERCRDSYETETHIFVHAQYVPDLAMEDQPSYILRWESLRDGVPGPHVSSKRVIAGHSSQKSGEILDLGHMVCIDTYCYGGGWLTALDVDNGEVWQVDRQGAFRWSRSG
jgi:serine/threonine protein phosphatase 1